MQLGIFAKTFSRPSVEDVFHTVARLGVHAVQFNFVCVGLPSLPDSISPELADRIRNAAVAQDVRIAAVSGTFNMIHPDPEQRRRGLRHLEVIADACPRLGFPLITLCTGTRDPDDMWRRHAANDSPEAWGDLLTTLTEALTTADKHELTLAIEPETGNVIDSALKARRLLNELRSPRLKIVLDAANLFPASDLPRMKGILEEAFDLLAPDLVLAHAKDLAADGCGGNLALGSGVLDWDLYLSLLRRANFAGPLIMHGFDEQQAEQSVSFIRSLLKRHLAASDRIP
jgi:sugar phosphate isomerase/epimerase